MVAMTERKDVEMIFSEDFSLIGDSRLKGWCIHLVCLKGEGSFTYAGRPFRVKKNDAVVINAPEKVTVREKSGDMEVLAMAAPDAFLSGQLPANNYGIGGGISLYDNPIIPLSGPDAGKLVQDIRNIRDRISDTGHLFYRELIGGLALPLIYDLFYFHSRNHTTVYASDRTMYVVKSLVAMLDGGSAARYRDVAYYAGRLNVTSKYLSDTVKRQTGKSVTWYISRYAVQMIRDCLDNPVLSLMQISDILNFSSLSYFSRYVKKHLGMSPKAYRESLTPH